MLDFSLPLARRLRQSFSCRQESLDRKKLQRLLRLQGRATAEKTPWAAVKDARFLPHPAMAADVFIRCLEEKWHREMLSVKPAVADFLQL